MKEFDLKVKVKKSLFFWSCMSVAWVVSIPLMVVALVNGNWLVAVPCIAVAGINFYALPFGWLRYGILVRQRNIYMAITDDEITDIRSLSSALGRRPKGLISEIQTLISKRYLRGYVLSEDCSKLIRLEKPKPTPKAVQTHCVSCGAVLPANADKCAYCQCPIVSK